MIRIITDSTSSIPKEIREANSIEALSLFVNRGDVEYVESEMDLDSFYQDIYSMVDDIPVSSQPSPDAVRKAFTDACQAGDSVLGIFLSGKMSGTYESAVAAAKEVEADHPGFSYCLIDSMTNCMQMGWSVLEACKAKEAGKSLCECAERAMECVKSTRFIFVPESLRFLKAGGRLGKASALIGNLLSVSPILTVVDGMAATHSMVRTQKKAMDKMVSIFKEDIAAHGLKEVCVHYIGSRDLADKWAKGKIEPLVGREVMVAPASPVIGCHVGPAVGIAYEVAELLSDKIDDIVPFAASPLVSPSSSMLT